MFAPWQRVEDAPNANIGVLTVGVVVTVCDEVTGPLQPVALAVMVDIPLQPAAKFTVPVVELIELPKKAAVVASRLKVMPVLLVDVAE